MTDKEILVGNIHNNRIIITSTQYPRYGGAATCAYELHKYMLKNGVVSTCIFFDNGIKRNQEKLNPDKLLNVFAGNLSTDLTKLSPLNKSIADSIDAIYGGMNYVVYAFNYIAPIVSRMMFPKSTIYYLLTGCRHINADNLVNSRDMINSTEDVSDKYPEEKKAIQVSDIIIPNSDLTKVIFERCYRLQIEDPVDMRDIFNVAGAKPTVIKRPYDILFISSNFTRKVKNVDMVKVLFNDNTISKYSKLCIGKESETVIGNSNDRNITCKNFMTQKEIISHLNESKIVIIPSFVETYSITAVEGYQCGCIVLASSNTACSGNINDFFVLNTYNVKDWANKIDTILKNYTYYKQIFDQRIEANKNMNKLCNYKFFWNPNYSCYKKVNIVCCSVDIPYIGGCGTNMYNIIKALVSDSCFNVSGIFVSEMTGKVDPDNIGNIYKVPSNVDTGKTFDMIAEKIEKTYGNVDFVLAKNYKIVQYARRSFPRAKLVFSPSGLRSVSAATASGKTATDGKKSRVAKINTTNIDNIYKYIADNDKYMDGSSLKISDIVIPNSKLAYQLINKDFQGLPNLYNPIYTTNIGNVTANNNNFTGRPFDIIFCAYNWNRPCKNFDMLLKIVNHPRTSKMKIVVVGNTGKCVYVNRNVLAIRYIDNNRLAKIFENVKVMVIPSTFDSNPNVLVEAIVAGCNVVTSDNVGNSENLSPECIVKRHTSVESWIDTIQRCMKVRYKYIGPTREKIMRQIKRIFKTETLYRKAVAVFKIPPILNNSMTSNTINRKTFIDYERETDTAFAERIIEHDIYFKMFVKLAQKANCTNINYIIFDSTSTVNTYTSLSSINPTYGRHVTIWKLKDIESFAYFMNADFYMLRGTYYNFFKNLVPPTATTVFYPATSFKQSLNGTYSNNLLTTQKFDVILCHSDVDYSKMYNAKNFIHFNKFANDMFTCDNLCRDIDFCYVATHTQKTKNHDLFLSFVKYCDDNQKKLTFLYVGDIIKIISDNPQCEFNRNSLKHVKLLTNKNCNANDLSKYYNRSKINILFSGRDAWPRVINESAACGCYNVALDTLSDGKSFYDGVLGQLVGHSDVKRVLRPGGSLAYLSDSRLWNQIIDIANKSFDHNNISIITKNKYNVDLAVQSIPV